MAYRIALALVVVAAAAACSSTSSSPYSSPRMGPSDAPAAYAPPMDQKREVAEQDCSRPLTNNDGNLRCK
jgi:hypothetical protein